MKKIKTSFSANRDDKNIDLAMNVCKKGVNHKKFKSCKPLLNALLKSAGEFNDARAEKMLGLPGNTRVVIARAALIKELNRVANAFQYIIWDNPKIADKLIKESGFEGCKVPVWVFPEFKVSRGKESLTARARMHAARHNGKYVKATYYFEISKDGKTWDLETDTSASHTFQNLKQGIYYFRGKVKTKHVKGEYTEVVECVVY